MITVNWKRAAEWAEEPTGVPPSDLLLFTLKKGGKKIKAPGKPAIRFPKGKRPPKVRTAQAAKKDLRKELEALCKAIVVTRDCGSPEAREGNCISCGRYRNLQWGHFIRQQDSKWLQYDPRNTGGQCRVCNLGGGNVLAYAKAIDRRDGPGASAALQREAEEKDRFWRPNKITLSSKLAELQRHSLAPKASIASPMSAANRNPETP